MSTIITSSVLFGDDQTVQHGDKISSAGAFNEMAPQPPSPDELADECDNLADAMDRLADKINNMIDKIESDPDLRQKIMDATGGPMGYDRSMDLLRRAADLTPQAADKLRDVADKIRNMPDTSATAQQVLDSFAKTRDAALDAANDMDKLHRDLQSGRDDIRDSVDNTAKALDKLYSDKGFEW